MLSIIEEIDLMVRMSHERSLKEGRLGYLLVEAPTISSAAGLTAKAMAELQASMKAMPSTQKLMATAVGKLKSSIAAADGEDDEAKAEAQALFVLTAQFSSAFTKLLNAVGENIAVEGAEGGANVIDVIGGVEELKGMVEKYFVPTPGAFKKATDTVKKFSDAVSTAKDNIETLTKGKGAEVEEADEVAGRGSSTDEIDEGIFGDIAGGISSFLKGIFGTPPKDSKNTIRNLEKLFGGNIAKALATDFSRMKVSEYETLASKASSLQRMNPEKTVVVPPSKQSDASADVAISPAPPTIPSNVSPKAIQAVADNVSDVKGGGPVADALNAVTSGDEEKWKKAYEDLNKKQQEYFKLIIDKLEDLGKKAEKDPEAVIDAVEKDAPEKIGPDGKQSDFPSDTDAELDILDDILTSKQLKGIAKIGGPKAAQTIDKKISGDEELKKALELAGRVIRGNRIQESSPWVRFLLSEDATDIPPEVVKKLTAGEDELGSGKKIDTADAEKIAKVIKDAGSEKKEKSSLKGKVADYEKKAAELEKKIGELENSALESKKKFDSLSDEKQQAVVESEKLKDSLDKLAKELSSKSAELSAAVGDNKELANSIKELQKKMEEASEKGDAESVRALIVAVSEFLPETAKTLVDAYNQALKSADSGAAGLLNRFINAVKGVSTAVADAITKPNPPPTDAEEAKPAPTEKLSLKALLNDPKDPENLTSKAVRAAIKNKMEDKKEYGAKGHFLNISDKSNLVKFGAKKGLNDTQKAAAETLLNDVMPKVQDAALAKFDELVGESLHSRPSLSILLESPVRDTDPNNLMMERWQRLAGLRNR